MIGVTDVKDYTSNNITWDLPLRLRTHPTQNKYKKIVVLKLIMVRNARQHGGFLCLSSALIQHSKLRIYIDYA